MSLPMSRPISRASSGNATKRTIRNVGLLGDSLSVLGGTGLTDFNAVGYWVATRMFGGSKWDPVRNGSSFAFASIGATTATILSTHLPLLLVSGADSCFEAGGLNDCLTGVATALTVANRVTMWTKLRSAGITPYAFAITPVPLGFPGNSGGALSAAVVAANAAVSAAAAANGVVWINHVGPIETVVGNGIAGAGYTLASDDVHLSVEGASRVGRVAAAVLAAKANFSYDPFANLNAINGNPQFAGSAGQPTGWGAPTMSGSTLNSKTLVDGGNGYNCWRLDVTYGGSGSIFLYDVTTPGLSLPSTTLETVIEAQVISGSFFVLLLQTITGGTGSTQDQAIASATSQNEIQPGDGIVVLRTPYATIGSGATDASPQIAFRGTGVIQFRRPIVRQIA